MPVTSLVLAAEEGGDFTDINFATGLWTLAAFAVTFVILSRFAWPKLQAAIESREERIADGLRRAQEAEELARQLAAKSQRILDEARRDGRQLLADARAAAEREANDFLRRAQQELGEQRKTAKEEVRREQEQALHELREASVDFTLLTVARLLKRELSEDERRRWAAELRDELALAA